jgi:phosphatidylglycerophosphate synthase
MSPTAGVQIAALAYLGKIQPNALTIAGFMLALPIAALNLTGHLLWACVVLHLFYAVDCADGILARALGKTSAAGAFLDDLAHSIVPPAYFMSLAFWAMWQMQFRLAILSALFAAIELAYRNVIQSMKGVPRGEQQQAPARSGAMAWLVSSFHLPTASVFVTAAVLWPELLTAYLAYATAAALAYFAYATFRVAGALSARS